MQLNSVSINYIELNKASSLLVAYWTVNNSLFDQLSDSVIQNQVDLHQKQLSEIIEKERKDLKEQI